MPVRTQGNKDDGAAVDRKKRFGGLLENPFFSKGHHVLLDGGRIAGLRKALKPYSCGRVLDVGCGLGECSSVSNGLYYGLDNSLRRVQFASRRYRRHVFLVGEAGQLPFANGSFDTAMLIDTSHHLSDERFFRTLVELKRVSKKYVVVSDPVVTEPQNRISAFFYSLDRGGCYRTIDQMKKIFDSMDGMPLVDTVPFCTFPGIYLHTAFILQK